MAIIVVGGGLVFYFHFMRMCWWWWGKDEWGGGLLKFCVPNPQNFVQTLFTRSALFEYNCECVCMMKMSEIVEIMIIFVIMITSYCVQNYFTSYLPSKHTIVFTQYPYMYATKCVYTQKHTSHQVEVQ